MGRRLFSRQLNYGLVLLLVSLLAYTSIGLCLNVSPVQADTLPVAEEDAQVLLPSVADVEASSSTLGLAP
jgi:hypothetical protein